MSAMSNDAMTPDWIEAWSSGFNAAKDIDSTDGPAVMARMADDFHMSGSQLAKRALAGKCDARDNKKIATLRNVI